MGIDTTWKDVSGWTVKHCGHPTANYPYYLISPEGDEPIVAANGRGFRSLAAAKGAAKMLATDNSKVILIDGVGCVSNIDGNGNITEGRTNGK